MTDQAAITRARRLTASQLKYSRLHLNDTITPLSRSETEQTTGHIAVLEAILAGLDTLEEQAA